jgi:uncharacterized protein DUF4410
MDSCASVDSGSAITRVVLGFGSGASELKTAVEGSLMPERGLRRLGSGAVDSGGGKTPAAVPQGNDQMHWRIGRLSQEAVGRAEEIALPL